MTLKDFRDAREDARREWHLRREEADRAIADCRVAQDRMNDAMIASIAANQAYRERKAEWRVARDWKLSSLGDVKMVRKLRGDAKS